MKKRDDTPGDALAEESGLIGGVESRAIVVVPYRQEWFDTFRMHAARIAAALGEGALGIDHSGSTAVPGLAAKPIVDMLLAAANPADEGAYLRTMDAPATCCACVSPTSSNTGCSARLRATCTSMFSRPARRRSGVTCDFGALSAPTLSCASIIRRSSRPSRSRRGST